MTARKTKAAGRAAAGGHVPVSGASVVGDVLSSKETVLILTVQDKSIAAADLDKLAGATGKIGL